MEKEISCGILFFNDKNQILLCHVTGNDFWDIPKGKLENNETYIETAIRETIEETGFKAKKEELIEIGLYPYNKKKNIYLFKYIGDKYVSSKRCHCEKTFIDSNGVYQFEMDDWKFMNVKNAIYKTSRSLSNLLKKLIKEGKINV